MDTVADSEYYEGVTMASTLKDMVNALPNMENITLAYKTAIQQLRDVYDGMSTYQQQFVPDETLGTLREYEERIQELVKQEELNSSKDETTVV